MTDEPTGTDWMELAVLLNAKTPPPSTDRRTAWMNLIWVMHRIRALKMHYHGQEFEDQVRRLRFSKIAAYKIVRSGVADHLPELWSQVHTEAYAAAVRGVEYVYPGLLRMIQWFGVPHWRELAKLPEAEIEARILAEVEPHWMKDDVPMIKRALMDALAAIGGDDEVVSVHHYPYNIEGDHETSHILRVLLDEDGKGVELIISGQ